MTFARFWILPFVPIDNAIFFADIKNSPGPFTDAKLAALLKEEFDLLLERRRHLLSPPGHDQAGRLDPTAVHVQSLTEPNAASDAEIAGTKTTDIFQEVRYLDGFKNVLQPILDTPPQRRIYCVAGNGDA